eukprot:2038246-Alexandrium_andersonii.AAC.1
MSASLVGSEMCIRDSTTDLHPIPPEGCLISQQVTVFRGPESEGYPFPVSYTHLTLPTICSV